MAVAAIKTFVPGEVLYAVDLNRLNTNILSNGLALVSPLTGNLNINDMALIDVLGLKMTSQASPSMTDGHIARSGIALGGGVGLSGSAYSVYRTTLGAPSVTSVGNIGAGEDDLMSIALEAGFFTVPNRAIRVTAGFYFAANGNVKTLKFYLGTSVITLNNVTNNHNNVPAYADLLIRRFSTNAQRLTGQFVTRSCTDAMPSASWTETEANALTLKFTGQSGSSATDDIVQFLMMATMVS